ncbi:MAG: DoxX family protein [Alistipes sp.]|nr:DoxX family protein [Alistipes sp.]
MTPKVKHIGAVALRWLLGGVFIFSGIVKCVDPVGTLVFVDKYLATYSLEDLLPLSLGIAVTLAVVEVMMGILLVIGVLRRYTALSATILLLLFTCVTLLSATVLPIGDCGCFGDAVKLTPWQTFAKNVVLLTMAVVVWRSSEKEQLRWRRVAVVVAMSALLPLAINLYSLRYLPLVDFMPYKVGVNLRAEVAQESEAEDVRSVLVFEDATTGAVVEYPADDVSCWENPHLEYRDAYTEMVSNGEGVFADFRIYNREGEDVTLLLLERPGRVAWLCVNDVDMLTGRCKGYVELLQSLYPKQAIVVLTNSDPAYVAKLLNTEVYTVDAMTLRSMVRADVGLMVVNSGVVEFKSDIRDI